MTKLHPVVLDVTERIKAKSRDSRADYLERMAAARAQKPQRTHLSCGNLAHGFAACGV
jgi:phosphogluconate dehydratase